MYIFHKISLQFDFVLISNNIEEINIEIKEKNSVFFSCVERRKRQRAEDSMYRRREMQERFNISVGTRYRTSRQSTDTGMYNEK